MGSSNLEPNRGVTESKQTVNPADSERPQSDDPLVQPLGQLKPGDHGRVVHLTRTDPDLMIKLSNLGLVPGAIVLLRQLRPAAVVSIGSTTLALDPEIARKIYVTRVGPG